MTLFTLSPLTKKRLERFRRSRVAFWSLCLLCLIYVLSLCAELICNGKPLMMRFDGETYFPFLRELPPQAVLDATGERVYVNYREFVRSEVFTQNPDNYALFAPIPYSPDETLDTKDLERDKIVTLTLVPTQPVGRFNLTQDLAIVRQDNCLQFFPKQTSSRDLRDGQISLYDFIDVTPKLADEIARRIGGEDLGPYETTVAPAAGHDLPWKRLSLTLAPTAIGEGSTRTLRVTLRLADGERFLPTRTFAFTRDFDDDGRPGELRFLPEQSDSQPDDKLLAALKKWANMSFYDTVRDDAAPKNSGVPILIGKLTQTSDYGPAGTPVTFVPRRWVNAEGKPIPYGIDLTIATLAQDLPQGKAGAQAILAYPNWEVGAETLKDPTLVFEGRLAQDCPQGTLGTPVRQVPAHWEMDGKPVDAALLKDGKLAQDGPLGKAGTPAVQVPERWETADGKPLANVLLITGGKLRGDYKGAEGIAVSGDIVRRVDGRWVVDGEPKLALPNPAVFFSGRLVLDHPELGKAGTAVRPDPAHWETAAGKRLNVRPVGDLTAKDAQVYFADEASPTYQVLSGNNIRFPFPPSGEHLFGLDQSGRDVFARIVYATRIAMSFGLLLAFAATLIGMLIGSIQGYFGGKVDICMQRFTEIWAALPFLYIMVLVGSIFGQSFWLLLLVYGLFCWLGLSYYMRAEFFRLRDRPFVAAARCQGLSNARIIFRHILPNALTPIITLFPFLLVGAISALVSLDFLGFGLPPLTPSWGELLNQAQTHREAWWLILFPSLAIFTVMFLTVMVGEGVRNAFDPKPFSKLQ